MKQKELIIFLPSIEGYGVEKNAFIISDYLSDKIDVTLITASKKYKNKFNKNIKLILPKLNFWDKLGRKAKYLICLFLLFKKTIIKKNFLVFCFQANIYCIILCRILNIKIIARSNSSPSGWAKNSLKSFIFKIILGKADLVLVNSLEFKQQLKNRFNVKAKCIYNPLNIKEIKKKSKIDSLKIFNNKKNLKIINIGRFVHQKDHLTMLKALKFIEKKVTFEAAIVGSGFLKDSLINYTKKNKMSKKVKFINFTPNVYPLIKQADIFILSSIFEGLPNVLLEATALKKFIISSNCPTGPKEILLNGKGGLLFKIRDHKELGEKIIYYLNNKKKCKLMLNNSIMRLDRFDENLNLKKHLNEINKLI
jgi:glycosyltransferase involved in cell wall biosynthesis